MKKEPINVLLGRLETAIRFRSKKRQLELLELIKNKVEQLGVKYPKEIILNEL